MSVHPSLCGDLRKPGMPRGNEATLPEDVRSDVEKMRLVLHRLVDIVADAGYLRWMTDVADSWCSPLAGQLAAAYLCGDLQNGQAGQRQRATNRKHQNASDRHSRKKRAASK